MSDPARQCAMMQNTQLVSPPLFNIPTKCLKKKKEIYHPGHLSACLWQNVGPTWLEPLAGGRGGGGGAHQEASGAFLWCHA